MKGEGFYRELVVLIRSTENSVLPMYFDRNTQIYVVLGFVLLMFLTTSFFFFYTISGLQEQMINWVYFRMKGFDESKVHSHGFNYLISSSRPQSFYTMDQECPL